MITLNQYPWLYDALSSEEVLSRVSALQTKDFTDPSMTQLERTTAYLANVNTECHIIADWTLDRVIDLHLFRRATHDMAFQSGDQVAYVTLHPENQAFEFAVHQCYVIDLKTRNFASQCDLFNKLAGECLITTIMDNNAPRAAQLASRFYGDGAVIGTYHDHYNIIRPTPVAGVSVRFDANEMTSDKTGLVFDSSGSSLKLLTDDETKNEITLDGIADEFPDMVFDFTKDVVLENQDVALLMAKYGAV